MKCIILAGGYATRLYPLTKNYPKPLLPVRGKPLLDYIVKKVIAIPQLDKIIVSTNKKFEKHFQKWMSKYHAEKIILEVEETSSEVEKLGAIKSIERIYRLYGKDDYLIVGGDNLFSSNLYSFVSHFQIKKRPLVAVHQKDRYDTNGFASIQINVNNQITNIAEKNKNVNYELIGTCIYALPPESLNKIPKFLEKNKGDSPGYFIEWLANSSSVFAYKLDGAWYDIGTIETYGKIKDTFEF